MRVAPFILVQRIQTGTGGGGGGASFNNVGSGYAWRKSAHGGSGVFILNSPQTLTTTGAETVINQGGRYVYVWKSDGSFTI